MDQVALVEQIESPQLLLGRPVAVQEDGSRGTNRGPRCKIAANTDAQAVAAWLSQFADSPNTLQNYTKEARRLLLWAYLARAKPLSSLSHEDMIAYEAFLADPQPAHQWIGAARVPVADPRWRPFSGPLTPASLRQSMTVVKALCAWLVRAGYLQDNPTDLITPARRRRTRSANVARHLAFTLWQEVLRSVAALQEDTATQKAEKARERWLLSLFWFGLRMSEMTHGVMGDFAMERDATGVERWWLHVLGKGDKDRAVPVTRELLDELRQYRTALGLSPLPHAGERTPLVLRLAAGQDRHLQPMSRSGIHNIIKAIFQRAAGVLETAGDAHGAAVVRMASAHWIRHSAGSAMSNHGDIGILNVRDVLGHESIATTNIYLHAEKHRLHDAVQGGHPIGWGTL